MSHTRRRDALREAADRILLPEPTWNIPADQAGAQPVVWRQRFNLRRCDKVAQFGEIQYRFLLSGIAFLVHFNCNRIKEEMQLVSVGLGNLWPEMAEL